MGFHPSKVLRLTKREEALEERLEGVSRENTELRSSLASLQARLALQDQLERRHSQQVRLLAPPPYLCVFLWERMCGPRFRWDCGERCQTNHLVPGHCKVYLQRWIPFWFSFELCRRNLDSGIWHVRILSTPLWRGISFVVGHRWECFKKHLWQDLFYVVASFWMFITMSWLIMFSLLWGWSSGFCLVR